MTSVLKVPIWVLTWRHGGTDHTLDFDTEDSANSCAIALEEAGRMGPRVFGPIDVEMPADVMKAVQERVRRATVARVQLARMSSQRDER